MKLSSYDVEILEILAEDGGFMTRDVAKGVTFFGSNTRQHSGAVRAWLMRLKEFGLVDTLDDQKPVCWKRTPEGTRALEEHERIQRGYEFIHKDALRRSMLR